jgi:hypothetical protein
VMGAPAFTSAISVSSFVWIRYLAYLIPGRFPILSIAQICF